MPRRQPCPRRRAGTGRGARNQALGSLVDDVWSRHKGLPNYKRTFLRYKHALGHAHPKEATVEGFCGAVMRIGRMDSSTSSVPPAPFMEDGQQDFEAMSPYGCSDELLKKAMFVAIYKGGAENELKILINEGDTFQATRIMQLHSWIVSEIFEGTVINGTTFDWKKVL